MNAECGSLGQDGCPTLSVTLKKEIMSNVEFSFIDTVNSQVHESTKHTPYQLVFGQTPRSVVLPDVSFKRKIYEEDIKATHVAK